ncbi:hypothetical protein [Sphingomonas abietis]|uniref:Uncharacterized protein n=1 Tax=Sphingomonas abietis TaxID=3012344 RepID=A0ABY7NNT9_9SPHN|nr:hypothetical protein [Sphingomonas abietis]WBO22640.1 hypothetical protein PBT88_00340 [Sphingomonas abietis]
MARQTDSFTVIARRMRKAPTHAPAAHDMPSIEDMLRNIDVTIARRRAA